MAEDATRRGWRTAPLVALVTISLMAPASVASAQMVDPPAEPGPQVSVVPDRDLLDGQTVSVEGSGFPGSGSLNAIQCRQEAASVEDCDLGTVSFVNAAPDGTVSFDYSVRRVLLIGSESVDCATAADACFLAVATFDAVSVAAAPLHFDPDAALPDPPTIVVEPNRDLVHLQSVAVEGSGFPGGGLLNAIQCRQEAASVEDCDLGTVSSINAAPDGTVSFDYSVRRVLLIGSESVDCATAADACFLAVATFDARSVAAAALHFDPDGPLPPPVEIGAAPTTGLGDGQVVGVTGSGLSPGSFAFVQQCSSSGGCRGFSSATVEPDGTLAHDVAVRRLVPSFSGGSIDCADAPGTCELSVSVEPGFRTFSFELAFDPDLPLLPPPTLDVAPAEDLVHGQQVTARGDGFAPGSVVLEQCALEDSALPSCSFLGETVAGPDGSFEHDVRVRRQVTSWPDVAEPGFTWVGDGPEPGGYQHWVDFGAISDQYVMDPEHPESLVFHNTGDGLELQSALYILGLGATMDDIPEEWAFLPGWHIHDNVCLSGTQLVGVTDENGNCPAGSVLTVTPPMVHVWIVDTECGRFAGVDENGLMCDHDGGHGDGHGDPPGMGFPDHWSEEQVAKAEGLIAATEASLERYHDLPDQTPDPETGPVQLDCAVVDCVLRAGEALQVSELTSATVPLHFDPDAPLPDPQVAVTPATGLEDGDVVTVEASGFLPGADLYVAQCLPSTELFPECDSQGFEVHQADEQGTVEASFTVRSSLFSGTQDCTATAGACVVTVIDPQSGIETASAPLTFGSPSIGEYTARFDEHTCTLLEHTAERLDFDSVEHLVSTGVHGFGGVADAGDAHLITDPPANDGPCEITVAWSVEDVARVEEIAAAWGVSPDVMHHLGGRIVLVLLYLAIVAGQSPI